MSYGLQLVLLVFAVVGFGGTGDALAVARHRRLTDGERDLGMLAVAAMLCVFGTLCTIVAVGLAGVFAFGGVVLWAAYVFMAQHMGIFRVELHHRPPFEEEERAERGGRA